MYDSNIKKLSKSFYDNYPKEIYPEIMQKTERSYDVVIFELEILKDCYICVPFRSEMKHKNGYSFKNSERSKTHKSGLDFSKLVIIKKKEYIGNDSVIDKDEFKEFIRKKDFIHKNLEKYICDYIHHVKNEKVLHRKEFDRKYKYSTLKYFHNELNIF